MTTTRHRRLSSLIAAGVTAVAAMTALAPAANAMSEQEIQHNCDQANGNYYTTGVAPDGHTYSACCYHNTMTHQNLCMSYTDGEYSETDPAPDKVGPPPLGPRPVRPPVAPPITNPPPAANAN
jgi:hypothetical protein